MKIRARQLVVPGCKGPRPEYFMGPEWWPGLPNYQTPHPGLGGKQTVWLWRVFAQHRDRFELLHMGTFGMN